MRRFSIDSLTSEPWRNGGGITRTVATGGGAHARDWDWRVSVADIAQNGPFSVFPKVDRHLTLIEGGGIVLHGVSGSMRLASVGDGVAFPGEQVLNVELIDGPVRVWNLMTRRGEATGLVHVHGDPRVDVDGYNVALVIAGEFALPQTGSHEEIVCAGEGIHVVAAAEAPRLRPLCKRSAVLCTVIRTSVTQM